MTMLRWTSLAMFAVLGALALGAMSASASTFIRTDPGGGLLSGSTTIRNTTSDTATFASLAGTMDCSQTFLDADLNASSSATSISGTLTALTFTSCTGRFGLVPYPDCSLHAIGGALPTITISPLAIGGAVTLNDVTVRCATTGTNACYYTSASIAGAASNAASSISFTNFGGTPVLPAGTTDAAPPGNCGSSFTASTTLTHIVQGGTNRTITITTS